MPLHTKLITNPESASTHQRRRMTVRARLTRDVYYHVKICITNISMNTI
uniref:Uncharacterized protein n=1 Tax=Heterorhabditis bacteriophora TaxID=37862 RepID=A0A1I7WEV0_HETBA